MTEDLYTKFELTRVINAVGYATRVGGGVPSESVIAAIAAAHRMSLEIDDLHAAASVRIHRFTGAEAGIVTCGAGAGLALAAAACLAGNDPNRMDQLPDTSGLPRKRIIYPKPDPFDYDHAVRLSGALLDVVDYARPDALKLIEQAIGPETAAIGHVWKHDASPLAVRDLASLAHRHGLKLIVDGALALPPADRLRRFIEDGADLVAVSGGKHLGGPQASGLLFGKRDLVRSAWVQMVDMDVRNGTWSLQSWIDEGWISRPPRHGIGRAMKVSKEAIIGCLVAMERYEHRDLNAELRQWHRRVDRLHEMLNDIDGLEVEKISNDAGSATHACPMLRLQCADAMTGVIMALRAQRPKVILAEDESDPRVAYIYPMCFSDNDTDLVAMAIRACFGR